jgi:anti-sigma B factor antagonist
MSIKKRNREDVCVLDFVGSILLKEGGDELRDTVAALLHSGKKKLVLNLSRVTHMDSGGLGDVVECHALATRLGGALKIANLTRRVHDLLCITKLVTVFETYDHEDEAVQSFALRPVGSQAG